MKTYLIALTMLIAMVATACGDDGGSGASTSAPTDERGQQIVAILQADEDFPLSDDQANCTANNMVANLDDSTIDAMIANPDGDIGDVTDGDEAIAALDAMLDCVDVEEMMVDSMVADGTPQDQAECVAQGFGEDELRNFMRTSALPDDEVDEAAAMELLGKMFELAEECGFG